MSEVPITYDLPAVVDPLRKSETRSAGDIDRGEDTAAIDDTVPSFAVDERTDDLSGFVDPESGSAAKSGRCIDRGEDAATIEETVLPCAV